MNDGFIVPISMKKLFVFVLMVAMVIACGPKEDPEIAVTGVSLSQSAVTLEVGGTSNLTATVQPSNATAVQCHEQGGELVDIQPVCRHGQ